MTECFFYFDISSLDSFLAASRIEAVARFTGAKCIWIPVFEQSLKEMQPDYDPSRILQASSRRKLVKEADLQLEAKRCGLKLPLKPPSNHPIRTVDAGRIITHFIEELRPRLALALFASYWLDQSSLSQAVLLRVARNVGLRQQTPMARVDAGLFSDVDLHNRFAKGIEQAYRQGAFSTPSFYVPSTGKLFCGSDRLHLLEAELTSIKLGRPVCKIPHIERLLPRTLRTPPEARHRVGYLWADFSSPWSALAFSQLDRMRREFGASVTIEFKPFFLGALLKRIGSPLIPLDLLTQRERDYQQTDLRAYATFWSAVNTQQYPPLDKVTIKWPTVFPIRSTLALRVAIIEPRAAPAIFKAAWQNDVRIDESKCLAEVLDAAGLPGQSLVIDASSEANERGRKAYAQLRQNTEEAVKLGLCGAPTWQLGHRFVFGQDRIPVFQDLVSGWRPESSNLVASVGSFPYFDYRL